MALNPFKRRKPVERSWPPSGLGLDQGFFGYGGLGYPLLVQSLGPTDQERPASSFTSYVKLLYETNGIVFACIAARMLVFAEARFQFQQMRSGRPGDLFGTPALDLLETPWPNATTSDLLSRMIVDADMSGNAFVTLRGPARPGAPPRIKRLRPDWMTIVAGTKSGSELDAEIIGYSYQPGGPQSGHDPVVLLPELVAHFAPFPDPCAEWRGMSWMTPVISEILGDSAATSHKLKFFENGATPNLVVSLGQVNMNVETFGAWVDKMEATHAGSMNAYKTLYLAAGADAKVIGSDLQQVDFRAVQGAGETRIAAAARVPPVIVGLSEGLQGSSLNAGNYQAAKRAFVDGTIRPLWRNAAGSLETIVPAPGGARLWYDDRHIPYLQEDRKDAAEIQTAQDATIRQLVDAGYEPDSVIAAVMAEDFDLLNHSGMFSVQLHPAGTVKGGVVAGTPVPDNGNGTQKALPAPSSN
jgi:phage portal protein BeeE